MLDSSRKTAIAAAAIMLVAASVLTGCQSRLGNAIDENTTRTPVAEEGVGGAGSVTVSITQPVEIAGHVDTTVTCTPGRVYTAHAEGATVEGATIAFTVTVRGFDGPGSYDGLVSASITESTATETLVSGVPGVPVTISETGGSIDLSASGSAGRTVAGSFDWACS